VPTSRQTLEDDPVTSDRQLRICVVCAGNICRSPMAEAVLRQKVEEAGLGDRVVVDSAGTGDWHVGQPAHQRSTAALRRRGYQHEHRARQFERSWFGERDLVLALDEDNHADLLRIAPAGFPVERLRLLRSYGEATPGDRSPGEVPDPYGQDDTAYDHALDLIEAACEALVTDLAAQLAEPDQHAAGADVR
jgi:protein-tyrosine phosphatase